MVCCIKLFECSNWILDLDLHTHNGVVCVFRLLDTWSVIEKEDLLCEREYGRESAHFAKRLDLCSK